MWEAIKTAPRNGTAFLACKANPEPPGHLMAVCYLSSDGTLCFDATGEIVDEEFQPTHWMRLPAPPSAA